MLQASAFPIHQKDRANAIRHHPLNGSGERIQHLFKRSAARDQFEHPPLFLQDVRGCLRRPLLLSSLCEFPSDGTPSQQKPERREEPRRR